MYFKSCQWCEACLELFSKGTRALDSIQQLRQLFLSISNNLFCRKLSTRSRCLSDTRTHHTTQTKVGNCLWGISWSFSACPSQMLAKHVSFWFVCKKAYRGNCKWDKSPLYITVLPGLLLNNDSWRALVVCPVISLVKPVIQSTFLQSIQLGTLTVLSTK